MQERIKKVLFVATVTGHIKAFHLPYLKQFKEWGLEVHVATLGQDTIPYCDVKHDVPFRRSPFSISNLKAYFLLKRIIKKESFDIIHCHTPMGGMLGRLCGKSQRKKGTRIIYTAHGFHFYKGAPLLNWLLYYPIEIWLSRYTDTLITINREDYELAKRKMRAKDIRYVPGVGVDTERSLINSREAIRQKLGIPGGIILAFSAGELSPRKNHETAIRAIAKTNNPLIHYYIAGEGELEDYLQGLVHELNLTERVRFLGQVTNVNEWCASADIFLFPSKQEGLPVALMEAMATGLPCVVSNIRGNTDLIEPGKGGYLCATTDTNEFSRLIIDIINNPDLAKSMGEVNLNTIKKFEASVVMDEMTQIYKRDKFHLGTSVRASVASGNIDDFLELFLKNDLLSPESQKLINDYYRSYKKIFGRYIRHYYKRQTQELMEIINSLTNPRVLEIGCGCGTESLYMALHGAGVVGIDITNSMINTATERKKLIEDAMGANLSCEFHMQSLFDLDESKKYDIIWMEQAFHHLEPRTDVLKKLEELVVPGGHLIISETNALNPLNQLALFKARGFNTIINIDGHMVGNERILSPRKLKQILQERGFTGIKYSYFRTLPNKTWTADVAPSVLHLPLPFIYTHYNLVATKGKP